MLCRHYLLLSSLLLLPSPVSADEGSDLVKRAITGLGGMQRLEPLKAARARFKGVMHMLEEAPRFTGEVYSQLPGQFKQVLQVELAAQRLESITILDKDKAWSRDSAGDKAEPVQGAELKDIQQSAYIDYVLTLLPLVQDNRFKLTKLEDVIINGETLARLKVESAGQPEVLLFFDKEAGLPRRSECRRTDPQTNKEYLSIEVFSDYREVVLGVADEQFLKKAGVSIESAALLEQIRKLTVDDARREQLRTLVKQLGDDDFTRREKAFDELVAQGMVATPLLRLAARDTDAEVAKRAQACLQKIGQTVDPALLAATLRILAQRRPAGTVETLLAFVPSVPDEATERELFVALASLARADGKPDPALVRAREDKDPKRKAAAEKALAADAETRLYPTGVKRPHKGIGFKDNAKILEWELLEMQYYSKLSDRTFAKP